MNQPPRKPVLRTLAIVAIGFGLLTIASGGRALFGPGPEREALGAVVPFVLWFNFVAGFFYVLTGMGLWLRRSWAAHAALALFAATGLVFAVFAVQALVGTAFEWRTVGAMTLRTTIWALIAAVAWRHLNR